MLLGKPAGRCAEALPHMMLNGILFLFAGGVIVRLGDCVKTHQLTTVLNK